MGMRHQRCPACGKLRRYDNGMKGDRDPRARSATWWSEPVTGRKVCHYCAARRATEPTDDTGRFPEAPAQDKD